MSAESMPLTRDQQAEIDRQRAETAATRRAISPGNSLMATRTRARRGCWPQWNDLATISAKPGLR